MKNIIELFIISVLIVFLTSSCEDREYSYLNAENLQYPTNNMTVVIGLVDADTIKPGGGGGGFPGFPGFPGGNGEQPSKYKSRIKNKAPWLSQPFWGASVEGARPLTIVVANVKTEGEFANADILKKEIEFIGEGVVQIPFETQIPIGKYLLSYEISNISGSQVVEDCFTIIVTDQKWK